jgi:hypothetical protein
MTEKSQLVCLCVCVCARAWSVLWTVFTQTINQRKDIHISVCVAPAQHRTLISEAMVILQLFS